MVLLPSISLTRFTNAILIESRIQKLLLVSVKKTVRVAISRQESPSIDRYANEKIKYSIHRENTLRIASGIILLVLLMAGNASALLIKNYRA